MTPKDKRDKLFKTSRPHIRPLIIRDGDKYHPDMGILWAAHQKKPFYYFDKNLDQIAFAAEIEALSREVELLIAEDKNGSYDSGFGPVIVVSVKTDGWRAEPHAEVFPWATPRNVLRCYVAFFQMIRYKQIGVCVARGPEYVVNLYNKCRDYGVLHYVGRIMNGDPRGDEYIYSIRGKRSIEHKETSQPGESHG